ncbi:MAG: M17 family metallopeptidase [Dongiaceae bacterium]
MPSSFTTSSYTISLHLVNKDTYPRWLKNQSKEWQEWLKTNGDFKAHAHSCAPLFTAQGKIGAVAVGVDSELNIWSIAHLPACLPPGNYSLPKDLDPNMAENLVLGWALAQYQFDRYKKSTPRRAKLAWPKGVDRAKITALAESIFMARDLINTPANDMGPENLAAAAKKVAKENRTTYKEIIGGQLLKNNYPLIHAVGKASSQAPRLVDISFGPAKAPKVTLVGKGVCFDTGGLDIKSADGMKLMKKDMGGAAVALGLFQALVKSGLNLRLRLLLPIVENSVSGNAFRPLDIIPSRKGLNVEIGNTDAEGRLILADALTEADQEKPDLLIDFATLTGAARIALGAEIPAVFSNRQNLAIGLASKAMEIYDPLWPLPLWNNYRKMLKSKFADLNNAPEGGYGGAITAALFLQEFVSKKTPWIHIDTMAWNQSDSPGRPLGGEALALRAVYAFLVEKYS